MVGHFAWDTGPTQHRRTWTYSTTVTRTGLESAILVFEQPKAVRALNITTTMIGTMPAIDINTSINICEEVKYATRYAYNFYVITSK